MRQRSSRRWSAALVLLLLVTGMGFVILGVSSLWGGGGVAFIQSTPTLTPLPTPPAPTATEPILPPPPTLSPTPTSPPPTTTRSLTPSPVNETATPDVLSPSPSASPTLTHTPTLTALPSPSTVPSPSPAASQKSLYSLRQRLGVGTGTLSITQGLPRRLGFGWYLDWTVRPDGFSLAEVEYMPMIRLHEGGAAPGGQALSAAVDALPGAVWLIGNEPDVKWQGNVPPDTYAQAYHNLYTLLKARDPTCQVAIGGVSQPTPLRLRYLDLIMEAYQAHYGEPMPVDVWNVHNFILREERDSWGVDIPPGMTERTGRLREIADHDDMSIFRQQILDFRRWMKERGQQDKPLIVTEYGILMPTDYGFPPSHVERFMLDTFEFFRTAADPALGYPADGYRLVQRWCWFSLADDRYPTGNLLQPDGLGFTPLGEAFSRYAHTAP